MLRNRLLSSVVEVDVGLLNYVWFLGHKRIHQVVCLHYVVARWKGSGFVTADFDCFPRSVLVWLCWPIYTCIVWLRCIRYRLSLLSCASSCCCWTHGARNTTNNRVSLRILWRSMCIRVKSVSDSHVHSVFLGVGAVNRIHTIVSQLILFSGVKVAWSTLRIIIVILVVILCWVVHRVCVDCVHGRLVAVLGADGCGPWIILIDIVCIINFILIWVSSRIRNRLHLRLVHVMNFKRWPVHLPLVHCWCVWI